MKNQIKPFKNRRVNKSKPVYIYRNLNQKGVVYSLRQNGLVVGHTTALNLKNCDFRINKKGQKRVRKEKHKNVHAFIKGLICSNNQRMNYKIQYNPYLNDEFVSPNIIPNGLYPVYSAKRVLLSERGVYGDYFNI
jgi:hypothetical protein